jgi:hypothetical protein
MAIFCGKKSHELYLDKEFLLGSQNKAGFLSKFYFAVRALVQFGSFLLWMMASPHKEEDIKSLTKLRKKKTPFFPWMITTYLLGDCIQKIPTKTLLSGIQIHQSRSWT